MPDQVVFEALIVNQTPDDLVLADKTPAGLQEHLLRGCSSVRINGEQRLLPWELTYRDAAIAQGPKSLLKRLDRSDGTTRVGLEIVFEVGGIPSVTETLPVGELPSETCPEEAP